MSIKINLPSYFLPYTNDKSIVEVKGTTVGECLNQLVKQFPDLKKMVFDKKGKLHAYIGLYVNGEDAFPQQLAKPVRDGDEIHILYIIGGG
jgi:molybdopterin converting factor small subunit